MAARIILSIVFTQAVDPPLQWEEAISLSAKRVELALEQGAGPGISVAVGYGESMTWAAGFGFSDIDARQLVDEQTMFRIGSVSKTLAASGLMRLWDQGKVDLDAPIQKYVEQFPEKRWSFSTRQVAGHLAGIRHYQGLEFYSNRPYDSIDQSLTIFQDDPLLFEPGTSYSYSTYGWTVVSKVMETASGKDFLEVMTTEVLQPLELDHTLAELPGQQEEARTSYYHGSSKKFVEAQTVDNSYKWAGGGFLSTPSDLVRFALQHLEPGYLSSAALHTLFAAQKTSDGNSTNYGIGWRSGKREDIGQWRGHSGGSVGGTTMLVLVPRHQLAVAVTINNSKGPAKKLAFDIAKHFAAIAPLKEQELPKVPRD